MVEPAVRDAGPAEYSAVVALTLAAYEQYDAVIPPGAWQAYAASIRDTLTNDPASARIVAAEGSVFVGAVLLVPPEELARTGRMTQPYPEIRLLATLPQARRRGVASVLLEACIRRTRAAGFLSIGLHSTEYMADAIRLYLRRGFVRAVEHDVTTPSGVYVMGFRLDRSNDV